MSSDARSDLVHWLVCEGLAGLGEIELLEGFCERCCAAGIPLSRAIIFVDTLHPIFEGHGFRWSASGKDESAFDYGFSNEGEAAESWRRSPFFAILESGGSEMRLRRGDDAGGRFPMVERFETEGVTDYLALIQRIDRDATISVMDCVYSHWATNAAEGFSDDDLAFLRTAVPALALAVKARALARIPQTLAHVYLGRDPGDRVLAGRIVRGVADRIDTVLWFSDLRSFTAITDRAAPADIIPFMNDYAEAAITSIQDAGGDVLKLIGDGILAIFGPYDDLQAASRAALKAEHNFRIKQRELNARRTREGRAATTASVALHIGEVFYGNIGSQERLDFTVVGPAVNEVSRIGALCRSVERDFLVSSPFRDALDPPLQEPFVSTGRFALRGVGRAQELFTLDPAVASDAERAEIYEQALARRPG